MPFPNGVAHIQISRKMGEDNYRYIFARLMTREIERLIKRQNVDTTNINCMMWPIVGLSRWATFKCLLTKRDIYNLMLNDPNDIADQDFFMLPQSGFKIEFSANNGNILGEESCYFSRMWLAAVQPLMTSYMGISDTTVDPAIEYGDAIFLCTVHCDRWAKRGNRLITDEALVQGMQYRSRSWDQALISGSRNSLDELTLKELAELIVTEYLHEYSSFTKPFHPLFRDATSFPGWESQDEFVSEISDIAKIPRGVDYLKSEPLTVALDRMLARAGYYISYLPKRDQGGGQYLVGAYNFHIADINASFYTGMQFIDDFQSSLIAGQIHASTDPLGSGFGLVERVFAIPAMIVKAIDANPLITEYRTQRRADGLPPNVFSQMHFATNPLLPPVEGQFWNGSLSDPFSRSLGLTKLHKAADSAAEGPSNCVFLRSDDTPEIEQATFPRKDIMTSASFYSDIESRYEAKKYAGTCDLYFRSWNFPGRQINEAAAFQDWAGGTHMELRLQTSEDGGFGFPVTRIHGDLNDWILGPVPENTGSDIEGSGIVQTWRGEDGRMRVHVGMPFGIPCLLRIVGSTQITAGIPAWEYTAQLVRVDSYEDPTTYAGGLEQYSLPEEQAVVLAYNLAECANTSSFAGPGYALPLPAFSVLPVGTDRNGDEHEVIVQAHLYMPNNLSGNVFAQYTGPNTRAYFCIHNPIDGVCANPLLDPNNIDGGVF